MEPRLRSHSSWGGDQRVAHAEVVAVPVQIYDNVPDGAVQMRWTDDLGFEREANVVRWWRLDKHGLSEGSSFEVHVQARQFRNLSFPPHHVSARLVVTGDVDDEAAVMVGDPFRVGSWAFGLILFGARLTHMAVLGD